jgi:hypothetical protein
MDPREGLWFAFSSIVIIAFYVTPLLGLALSKQYFWQIFLLSCVSCLLMFLWRVSVGEIGHVTCLGFDTKIRCRSGVYLMPALFPFLRGIDIIFGFGVEVPSDHHEGNTSNIRLLFDQRRPIHHVNTQAGFFGSLLSQTLSGVIFFLLDLRSSDGKVKYYKIGGIGYVTSWIITFASE